MRLYIVVSKNPGGKSYAIWLGVEKKEKDALRKAKEFAPKAKRLAHGSVSVWEHLFYMWPFFNKYDKDNNNPTGK